MIIEADPFSEADQKRFEEISSYFISCDKIKSKEMENLIKKLTTVPQWMANGKDTVAKNTSTSSSTTAATTAVADPKSSTRRIIEYPLNVRGASSVTVESYKYLAVGEYLDDSIIDFYAEYLRNEVMSTEQRDRTHIFSVFFYNVLTSRSARGRHETPGLTAAQKRHERVSKWTKDVNIFEKDFLVVPINTRSHWFLAIICFPALEMPVYMDSNEPVPTKRRRSANKSDVSKPIKQ